ncbi:glucokinase [Mangrovimicrobium sediminis]|uniref:Glucokinase n=1 Tax=Mangrovimicrobium sediminis TaxID=2562682 RepID=A0A4Z0M8B3_9GAMM|nr:glucokinase [Haliea sp. SAOS-164]TGD75771.1 glucokinase [Haliea sp. SAOS-164]
MSGEPRLVADVGGTNTRLALYDPASGAYRARVDFRNRDYDNFAGVIDAWLAQLDEAPPRQASLAIAAPLADDRIEMVNIGWQFSREALRARFGWRAVRWLNDFEANAHALPHLDNSELLTVQPGETNDGERLAVIGPGTGLGGATLRRIAGEPVVGSGEPGHAGLSPGNPLELEIFALLLEHHPDIYTELLVSGPGLQRLHQAITRIHGGAADALDPAQITARALDGDDPLCRLTLATFCDLLGSACGDFALVTGCWQGLFIAGGIVPRIAGFLGETAFLQRLQSKGAMRGILARMPVHIITASHPGLVGAAHAPLLPT